MRRLAIAAAALTMVVFSASWSGILSPVPSAARAKANTGLSFHVVFGDHVNGLFTEVSGLGSENELIEHKVLNEKGIEVVQKIPGPLKWHDIALKRVISSDDTEIWDWRQAVEDGKIGDVLSNGSILLLDDSGGPVAAWKVQKAWPSKVTAFSTKREGEDVLMEEVVIVHEKIERGF